MNAAARGVVFGLFPLAFACGLGPGACSPTQPPRAERAEPAATDEPAPRESALARARAEVTDPMLHHFGRAATIEAALIEGDLEAAQQAARSMLDDRPEAYPEPWAPYLYRQREAAEAVRTAETLVDAAAASGRLAASCGHCHLALGQGPKLQAADAPPACEDEASGMRAHAWAAQQMWRGVAVPSEEAWRSGAVRFSELPDCLPRPDDVGIEHVEISAVRAQIGRLADEATAVETLDDRGRIYGAYLGTCATCHLGGS